MGYSRTRALSCILVYDITNKGSFEELINYWVPELKQNTPKNVGMLKILFIYIILI